MSKPAQPNWAFSHKIVWPNAQLLYAITSTCTFHFMEKILLRRKTQFTFLYCQPWLHITTYISICRWDCWTRIRPSSLMLSQMRLAHWERQSVSSLSLVNQSYYRIQALGKECTWMMHFGRASSTQTLVSCLASLVPILINWNANRIA